MRKTSAHNSVYKKVLKRYYYINTAPICQGGRMEFPMKLEHIVKQTVKPGVTLTPAQIQSLQILSMDLTELDQFLETEHMENPMLDLDPVSSFDDGGIALGEYFRQHDYTEENTSAGNWEEHPPLELPASESISLYPFLRSQISREVSADTARLIELLITFIDPGTGYFTMSHSELLDELGCPLKDFDRALRTLREMDPPGVGAFSLSDSLKLQLDRQGLLDENLEEILDHYLNELAAGNLSTVSRSLNLSTARVKHYLRVIRGLNPYPAADFGESTPVYVIPDLRAKYISGEWEIEICRSRLDHIRLNTLYMDMAKNAEAKELQEYFKSRINRARSIIRAVTQRESTLIKIARFALGVQSAFALGTGNRCPLSMRSAAEALEISPSTLSRAVNGKYIELPARTCALKDLFPLSAPEDPHISSSPESRQEDAVAAIEEIIREEDPAHPLSDQKIADLLIARGLQTARRTVAKYREIAGIPPASARKVRN